MLVNGEKEEGRLSRSAPGLAKGLRIGKYYTSLH
jgi:hypothetical protein